MNFLNIEVENPGKQELRKFGLVTGAIVVVLFGLLLPWIFSFSLPLWPWIFCGISCAWGLAHPGSLFPVYRVWLKFGHILGWINTRIILGIMFYIVFFPAGIIMRLFGKDPMARKLDNNATSYRKISDPLERNHIERPY